MRISKGQILALTLFVLLSSLGIVLVLLMPINQQVIRIRKILNTFQALTFAESGLEVASLYSIKNIEIDNHFQYTLDNSNPTQIETDCQSYYNHSCNRSGHHNICEERGFTMSGWGGCSKYKINKIASQDVEVELYSAAVYKNFEVYSYFVKLISTGKYKGLERVLDFDFLP